MPEINNNNYNIWSKQLSQAWGNQDLSKDHYDYRKYYNDQPIVAWLQLNSILAHKQNKRIPAGHFPDKGASGTYKTKDHPTYPALGDKSWSRDNKIYYLSKDQYIIVVSLQIILWTIQVPIMTIIMVELKQFMMELMFSQHCILLKLKVVDLI